MHSFQGLLESSENYERALHKFGEHGITVKEVAIDVATMMARKDKIVDTFTGGIGLLFRKNKVALAVRPHGRFTGGVGTLQDRGQRTATRARSSKPNT